MTARNTSVDLAKSAAIFGVLIIHSAGNCLYADVHSLRFAVTVFLESAVRGSVPLFFMCSGVLFLDLQKPVSMKKIYTRSIPRLLTAMIFWGTLYKCADLIGAGEFTAPKLLYEIWDVLLFRQEFHLYFIHILLLVYAFVPVTCAFLKGADDKTVGYYLILWFILGIIYPTFGCFPPFSKLSGIPIQWRMNMTYAAIGYGILGRYLWEHRLSKRTSVLLFLAGIAFTFAATLIQSRRTGAFSEIFFEGMSIGPCLTAAGFWGICCGIRLSERAAWVCRYVSDASFCVYLVHVLILRQVQKLTGLSYVPAMIPVIAAVVFVGSVAVYAVLSKIPWVRKWLI